MKYSKKYIFIFFTEDCTQEPSEHACDYSSGNYYFNANNLQCEEPQFETLERKCPHPPNKFETIEDCEATCGKDRIKKSSNNSRLMETTENTLKLLVEYEH